MQYHQNMQKKMENCRIEEKSLLIYKYPLYGKVELKWVWNITKGEEKEWNPQQPLIFTQSVGIILYRLLYVNLLLKYFNKCTE